MLILFGNLHRYSTRFGRFDVCEVTTQRTFELLNYFFRRFFTTHFFSFQLCIQYDNVTVTMIPKCCFESSFCSSVSWPIFVCRDVSFVEYSDESRRPDKAHCMGVQLYLPLSQLKGCCTNLLICMA